MTDYPQPGVAGAKTKKFTLSAQAQGSVTGKTPTGEKTGTINSQLVAQAACRKFDKLKKQTYCEDSQKGSIGMGGRDPYNSAFKTEDRPQ